MDDFENWKNKLRDTFQITMYGCEDDREYQKASDEFDIKLKEALSANNSKYAKELLTLFCDDEDYGVLESCFRVLSNMDRKQVKQAFDSYSIELKKHSEFWYEEVKELVK